jgi:DNA polymerase III delta prime subunit
MEDKWAIKPIENPDKKLHEKTATNDDPLNLLHPTRLLLAGKPNSGKSLVALTCIARKQPTFERIVLYHSDPNTKEYYGIDPLEVVTEVPKIDTWDGTKRNLFIIDDVDLDGLGRDAASRLDRTLGYASTHSSVTVIVTCQNLAQIPIRIRRMMNVFCVWPPTDKDAVYKLARATSTTLADMRQLLEVVDNTGSPYAFMMIDHSGRGETYRLNGSIPIELVD